MGGQPADPVCSAAPMSHLIPFLLHWGITALSLWAASLVFKGLEFDSGRALLISALVLGLANAIVRPILVVLTPPDSLRPLRRLRWLP